MFIAKVYVSFMSCRSLQFVNQQHMKNAIWVVTQDFLWNASTLIGLNTAHAAQSLINLVQLRPDNGLESCHQICNSKTRKLRTVNDWNAGALDHKRVALRKLRRLHAPVHPDT
jgi:hypothetical protein